MEPHNRNGEGSVAFVLGSGSAMGAVQAGMVRALTEQGIYPDLVIGSSIGAFNGAILAADPTGDGAAQLERVWREMDPDQVVERRKLSIYFGLFARREGIYSNGRIRSYLSRTLPAEAFEDLGTSFHCVATDAEDGREVWFDRGPLVSSVLASLSVPIMFPSVEIDGRRYLDGGTVNDMPVARAVGLGARTVYVLEAGRLTRQFEAKRPFNAGQRAIALARRHRYESALATLPTHVEVHVLPTGDSPQVRFSDSSRSEELIATAYEASSAYLEHARRPDPGPFPTAAPTP